MASSAVLSLQRLFGLPSSPSTRFEAISQTDAPLHDRSLEIDTILAEPNCVCRRLDLYSLPISKLRSLATNTSITDLNLYLNPVKSVEDQVHLIKLLSNGHLQTLCAGSVGPESLSVLFAKE